MEPEGITNAGGWRTVGPTHLFGKGEHEAHIGGAAQGVMSN